MSNTIYFKDESGAGITSVDYSALANKLQQYPNGVVGVELPSGGTMQHYFYQMNKNPEEIHRYPIRNIGETYSCMSGYSPLLENSEDKEKYFGTMQPISPPPRIPSKGAVYFTADDMPKIDAIKEAARSEKLKPTETVPYFSDSELTRPQQHYLYTNYVLKSCHPFKEELNDILNHKTLSVDEKETILRGSISKERVQLSDEPEVLMRNLQKNFLTIGAIINYPKDELSTDAMRQGKKDPLTLGAIQAFYIRCIQSHLQRQVEKEALNLFAPLTAIIPLGRIAPTEQIESYKGLTEKEETCFNALNLFLMSGAHARKNLKRTILSNPKFLEVFPDLQEMFSDLYHAFTHSKNTTSNPKYINIYNDFFLAHEIELQSFRQAELDNVRFTLITLQPIAQPILSLYKFGDTLSSALPPEQRDAIKQQLLEQLNSIHPEIYNLAAQLLMTHQLLNDDERKALFLESVVKCRMEIVDLLLQQDPSLLLHQGNITDYSGREWQNITGPQYANWAWDTEMFSMMMKHIPLHEEGAKIRTQIKDQTDEADRHGIVYKFNGKDFKESHYNHKELTEAYENYLQHLDARPINWSECDRFWLLIGEAQRHVPVHVAHRYCDYINTLWPNINFYKPLEVRSLTYHNPYHGRRVPWFPLSSATQEILGQSFSIVCGARGSGRGALGEGFRGWGRDDPVGTCLYDLKSVTALFKAKTTQLAQLKEQSLSPWQDSSSASARFNL